VCYESHLVRAVQIHILTSSGKATKSGQAHHLCKVYGDKSTADEKVAGSVRKEMLDKQLEATKTWIVANGMFFEVTMLSEL